MKTLIQWAGALAFIGLTAGCSITGSFADGLNQGLQNQRDPQLVASALPTYILMVDGLIARDPDSETLLMAAAKLYSAYGSNFVTENSRAQMHTQKALDYARQAFCAELQRVCEAEAEGVNAFKAELAEVDGQDNMEWVYGYAGVLAAWVQVNSGDFNAIAALPKLEAMLARVTEVSPELDNGNPWIYRGVLAAQLPPSLGGKPETARSYFEKAIALTNGQNLMAKVMLAKTYARLVFNQQLHDQLLNEVLSAEVEAPLLTLANVLAQEQAELLLESGKDYF